MNKEGTNSTLVKTEYRVWNPFRSKLAACIVNGVNDIYMKPGSKVLYLGAANGTTVSHVADLVGEVKYSNKLFRLEQFMQLNILREVEEI